MIPKNIGTFLTFNLVAFCVSEVGVHAAKCRHQARCSLQRDVNTHTCTSFDTISNQARFIVFVICCHLSANWRPTIPTTADVVCQTTASANGVSRHTYHCHITGGKTNFLLFLTSRQTGSQQALTDSVACQRYDVVQCSAVQFRAA